MWDWIAGSIQNAIVQIKVDPWWEATAFAGEAVFGGRFVLQWLVSEYKKKSHVPVAFWYMSVVGSLILLVYCIHIEKPVLILAFSLQIGIYVRNLCLIAKSRKIAGPVKNEKDDG